MPTAAGERIAQNIDTIVALWEQIERTSALGATIGDHVTIGSHPDLWPVHGEELMANLDHEDQNDRRLRLPPPTHRVWDLPADELVLVADRPDRPTSCDPGYVFVDAGSSVSTPPGPTWPPSNPRRHVYLPHRLVAGDLTARRLHRLEGAPTFTRRASLVAPSDAEQRWPWFAVIVTALGLRPVGEAPTPGRSLP